jgi:hypothetical protein
MTRVLLIGLKPEAVDYSDPALPPGIDAEQIQAAINRGLERMTDRGWQAEACLVEHDATAGPAVAHRLHAARYDCVVIGAGVRLPAASLVLFEAIINAVHKTAPDTPIAFNTRPDDSADAAARWL